MRFKEISSGNQTCLERSGNSRAKVTPNFFVRGTLISLGKVLSIKEKKDRQRSFLQSPSPNSEGEVILLSKWSQSLRFVVPYHHQYPKDSYMSHKRKKRIVKRTERGTFVKKKKKILQDISENGILDMVSTLHEIHTKTFRQYNSVTVH